MCMVAANQCTLLHVSGSFARVWLATLKGEERKDKVYALKILRKANGKDRDSSGALCCHSGQS